MWGFQTTRMLKFMRPFSVYFCSHYSAVSMSKNFLTSEKTSVTQHSRKTTLKVKHFDGADFKPPLKRLWEEVRWTRRYQVLVHCDKGAIYTAHFSYAYKTYKFLEDSHWGDSRKNPRKDLDADLIVFR